jgi:hypothetical protein
MEIDSTALRLQLNDGSDDEQTEKLTRRLRAELLELDEVKAVNSVRGSQLPDGAKGDPVTLGTLLVTLAASGGVLTTIVNTVQPWLLRNEKHSVTVEMAGDKLTISGPSSDEQKRLVDDWIARHTQEKESK